MSDDSPQKGWDNWFDAEQDSPGGEQQASEQQVPPSAPQESEPETEAEQTSWTMPAIGAAPEGEAPPDAEPAREAPEPEPPQVQQPKPPRQEAPADDAAPTQHIAAVADNQATQYIQAKPSAAQDTWQPEPAQARDPAPAANPWADAQPTTQLPQAPQGSRNQQAPGSQSQQQPPQSPASQPQAPQQQPSPSEQPMQVWTAAPAAQQPSAPAQQPPSQNPYAAAATQQPAQPQQPPAYGAPPQGPPSSGYPGYQQQSGWDEQPERHGPGAASPVVTPAAPVPAAKQPKPQSNSRKKIFVSSGIGAVVIVALATILVMNNGSLTGSSHALAAPTGFQPTGTSVAGDAEQTADAFLAAWQNGDFKQAAAYTDAPGAAASMLSSYDSGLNLHGLQLTATGSSVVTPAPSNAASDSSPSGTTSSASAAPAVPSSTAGLVSFNVVAKVGLPAASASSTASAGASASASASASSGSSSSATASGSAAASSVTANWTYSSKLTAYKKNGGWWVQWVPSLVAPNLTASEKLVSSAIAPSAAEVEDSTGADLSSATDPGVHNIYLALKKNAPAGEGTPGVQIELATANGTPIANTADVLSQPVNTGVVKTTINPTDEAAAQQAVLKYADSSMVVIQPTTGDILAVANNDGDNDFALTAAIAPGSTDKILTSTALLTSGLVSSPSQQVVCPKQITVNGTVFNNSEGESEPANTPFLDDFAISCNNAFGQWYDRIGATTLADTAEKYYGLNQAWDIGTGESATYYTIPSSASNGELFQELFGQGQLETAPIAMASVAATVDSGTFKQPVVVPGAAQVTATSLPTSVQQDLWQMMHAVVTQSDGTAYGVFNGVNSTVYGKTGTADVGSTQDKPNSWMVVFDPTLNVAIACVVLDAGYGASYAGPETATALEAMQ